jgi:microcystin-dependent protein
MPSSNGVYSLPSGYLAVTGATILASQHNPPLEDIAAALTLRLSRDGTAPMTGPLQLSPGTVTAPGAVFSTDPSSGFYKTTAGIGVAIGGTQIAEFLAGGINGARVVGELAPFTGSTVPSALWVFPVGQTLSRTAYAAMWAFVQVEITNGNQFYNNGDGATTFGIGDLRGRTWAGTDNMGGTDANRLLAGTLAGVRNSIGGAGGADTNTLTLSQLPGHRHAVGINDPGHAHGGVVVGENTFDSPGGGTVVVQSLIDGSTSVAFTGIQVTDGVGNPNQTGISGSGAAHDNLQPTMLGNWIMFVGGAS